MIRLPLKNIVIRILWVFFLFLLFRILFHVLYYQSFEGVSVWEYWVGFLFDSSSFVHLFGLYVFFELLSLWFGYDFLNRLTFYSYLLGIVLLIFFSSIDLIYFSFTFRRTTSDVLSFITLGNDLSRLLIPFFIDFWYILILVGILIYVSTKIFFISMPGIKAKRIYTFLFSLLVIPIMVLMSRGGLQLKPITVISAAKYVDAQNTSLVLNTPFTFITTLLEPTVNIPQYYGDLSRAEQIFNPVKHIEGLERNNKNVVLIIVESLAKEYIGGYGNSPSYTPFIDSLMNSCTSFHYAFANGKRSIEALPAVISGLPTLMQAPIIYSPFAANRLGGIPSSLNKYDYNTRFYHGGHRGTMGFEAYCKNVGFDIYKGMEDYPDETAYDGAWGIFDEPFLQYMASDLDQVEEPFFTSLFTLSSHHPYAIPKVYQGKFPKGTLRIHETIGYVDHALKSFFKTVEKKPWYKNTVFILTADHTAQLEKDQTRIGFFAIPMLIFDPNNTHKKSVDKVVQQADLYPTVMHILGISDTIICYGNDMLNTQNGFALSYNHGVFQMIDDNYVYSFDGESSVSLFDYKSDTTLKNNMMLKINHDMYEDKIKGVIDSYGKRMNSNKLFMK